MAKELIINASLPEIRIALMEDGQIQELLIERDSDKGIVGNIYKGRVTRVLPGMQAAFVDIGLEKAAFLYVDDIYVHPKVMGDENEVAGDEDSAEGDSSAPIQAFSADTTDEIVDNRPAAEPEEERDTIAEALRAGATDHSEIPEEDDEDEEVDTSMLESHASEHFEREEDAFANDEDTNPMITAPTADDLEFADEDEGDDEEGDEEGDEDEEGEDPLQAGSTEGAEGQPATTAEGAAAEGQGADGTAPLAGLAQDQRPGRRGRNRRRGRRGRSGRGGENREGGQQRSQNQFAGGETFVDPNIMPESVNASLDDQGAVVSDRAQMEGETKSQPVRGPRQKGQRPEFKEPRGRDRRIKSKHSRPKAPASISDMLREGQEVIVQIAKDPIATKGARLTCHVSLPGRHLVCMPTIDHVGVSRRIERDDERRRLRDFVEKNRPRKMGFIVRTASGGKDPESWIKTDIDYLSKLWREIRTKTEEVSAPALIYEDLNSILRAIRDWVNEDIDRIVVDSRYYYNELMAFSERFMPQLAEIIELYQGDIPVFDAYGISGELHRSLERRVWLKSGGYIVIDQAEALVAIDVNTGRFVGKKSLEDTILKTNLEAAEEIAYQLRLRNCGGIIICDFIDMERDENRMRVYRALDEALKRDRARPTIQKISDLGLVEMTRKRTRDTVIRTLCEPCTHCEGKGYTKSTRTVAYDILREIERLSVDRDAKKILVSAHESVIDILAIDLREVLDQLERRYNKSVYLQSVMDFHSEQFEVATDRQPSKKSTGDIARQLRVERERNERKEKSRNRERERNRDRDRGEDREASDGGEDARARETGRDTGSDREARGGNDRGGRDRGGRGGRDRNRGGRDRNRDRDDNRNNNRNEHRNDNRNEGGGGEPRAAGGGGERGSFRSGGRPQMVVAIDADAPEAQALDAAPQTGEDQQGFQGGDQPSYTPAQTVELTGNEDEDQLAYLRAQAAQDAALANVGGASGQNPRGGGRNQNNSNRNGGQGGGRDPGRNGGGRGGRNDRGGRGGGRNDNRGDNRNAQGAGNAQAGGGNNRFRPGRGPSPAPGGGGVIQPRPATAGPAPQSQNAYLEPQAEPAVPDYEVLSSPADDGSET